MPGVAARAGRRAVLRAPQPGRDRRAHPGGCAASPVPLVLYNIPVAHRTGPRDRRHARARGHAQHRRREAGGRRDRQPTRSSSSPARRDDFAVLGGEDPFLLPICYLGGAGAICASAHVCTERFVADVRVRPRRARSRRAGRTPRRCCPVVQACFAEPNPAVFKARAARTGPDPDARRAVAARERVRRGAVDARSRRSRPRHGLSEHEARWDA